MNLIPSPRTIDTLDWNELRGQISRVKDLTRVQRDIYYLNALAESPRIQAAFADKFFALVNSLYCCRAFHEAVGLPYCDPHNENGQIIRVALLLCFAQGRAG